MLYQLNRAKNKTTIFVPDAGGLLIEQASFSTALAEAQVKATEFFKLAKSQGDKINRPSAIADLAKLTAYRRWSAAWIEIPAVAERGCTDEADRGHGVWFAARA